MGTQHTRFRKNAYNEARIQTSQSKNIWSKSISQPSKKEQPNWKLEGNFSLKPEPNMIRNVYTHQYERRILLSKTSHDFRKTHSRLSSDAQQSYTQRKIQSQRKFRIKRRKKMKPRKECSIIIEDLNNLFTEEQNICKCISKSNFVYKALWNYNIQYSDDRNVAYGLGIMKDLEKNLEIFQNYICLQISQRNSTIDDLQGNYKDLLE